MCVGFPGLVRVEPDPLEILFKPARYVAFHNRDRTTGFLPHFLDDEGVSLNNGIQVHGLGEDNGNGTI